MGNRLSLANSYLKKIKHLYNNAGPTGYDQALHAHSKINEYRNNSGERSSDSQELKDIAKEANEEKKVSATNGTAGVFLL